MPVRPRTVRMYVRLAERDAGAEAVRTLEDVTPHVHGEYARKLTALETELREVANLPRDRRFTRGSFVSFHLVHRAESVGVVNLTNRAQRGTCIDEEVNRVCPPGLVLSLIMCRNALQKRPLESIHVR